MRIEANYSNSTEFAWEISTFLFNRECFYIDKLHAAKQEKE